MDTAAGPHAVGPVAPSRWALSRPPGRGEGRVVRVLMTLATRLVKSPVAGLARKHPNPEMIGDTTIPTT